MTSDLGQRNAVCSSSSMTISALSSLTQMVFSLMAMRRVVSQIRGRVQRSEACGITSQARFSRAMEVFELADHTEQSRARERRDGHGEEATRGAGPGTEGEGNGGASRRAPHGAGRGREAGKREKHDRPTEPATERASEERNGHKLPKRREGPFREGTGAILRRWPFLSSALSLAAPLCGRVFPAGHFTHARGLAFLPLPCHF